MNKLNYCMLALLMSFLVSQPVLADGVGVPPLLPGPLFSPPDQAIPLAKCLDKCTKKLAQTIAFCRTGREFNKKDYDDPIVKNCLDSGSKARDICSKLCSNKFGEPEPILWN